MWIILVLIVSYACGDQLRISPAPLAAVDEHSDLTLTCNYNGTLFPFQIVWYSNNLDYLEYTYLDRSCTPFHASPNRNKTFTCNESIGKFQMTIIDARRDRHGQMWRCELYFSSSPYAESNWTMVNIRGNFTETSCFRNHDAEICPYPISRVEENKTLVITVKVNVTSALSYIRWSENIKWHTPIHTWNVYQNCTIQGITAAGYKFTCNPSAFTIALTLDQVQKDRNTNSFNIYILFDSRPSIDRYIFISVQGTETTPNITNPVSKTISTSSRSTASTMQSTSIATSMVPTTKTPPSYVPDPAINTTNPVSKPISTSSRSTASTMQSTSIATSMVPTIKPPPSYMPDPGEYELRLEFDLKVEMDYNETYADKTSPEFQSLATNFSVSLTKVFKNLKGFKSIDILRFRRGSVIVDYSVNVFATVDVGTVTEEIGTKIVGDLTSIAGLRVDTGYTHDSMTKRLDNLKTRDKCFLASANLCPFGYYCKPTTTVILCIDRCNSSVCRNNGECYVGHHSQDVQCRCALSEDAVYTGERCETKIEVVTVQERNIYIIIACSLIGGILLVCISTVCIINRKRKRLKKRLTIRHVLKLDEMHRTSENGVPAMDERYVIGINPALERYPEGYFDARGHVYHQDQGLDGGYMQVQDSGRHNSDPDYDYIHPPCLEIGSRESPS